MRVARPTLHTETLALLCALYLLLGLQSAVLAAALAGRDWAAPGNWGFALALFVALAAVHVAAVCLFATRRTVRPLLSLLLVAGAAVSFYTGRYSRLHGPAHAGNVLATNWGEAGELLGADLVAHLRPVRPAARAAALVAAAGAAPVRCARPWCARAGWWAARCWRWPPCCRCSRISRR